MPQRIFLVIISPMRRTYALLALFLLALACRMPVLSPAPTATWTPLPPTLTETLPPPTLTPLPTLTFTPTSPPPTATSTLAATLAVPDNAFSLQYHPDGGLYVGDLVSLSVISAPGMELSEASVTAQVDDSSQTLATFDFGSWGIGGRSQATLIWGWDTRGLSTGEHTLTFTVQPQGYSWAETVTLLSAESLPPRQATAQWASRQTACCVIHYITNTAVERDIDTLAAMVEQQAQEAIGQMGIGFSDPIVINILPRLLGHGGFAADEISVSYLDRNYAANSWDMVVHHEMAHILDGRSGGDLRPSLLVEGLAVYLAGGHYKPEPLMLRAAALLEERLNMYLPLAPLADDFYASQHEIGYLEGGALVQFLVETYGWEAFSGFYRDIHPADSGSQAEAMDAALQAHFGFGLDELESDFLAALQAQPDDPVWREDVRLTVRYFDLLRRYQELLDPSAYFRTAWLLDTRQMRERGIVADYLRHPSAPNNLALETLFIASSHYLATFHFAEAETYLDAVSMVLDAYQQGATDPLSVHPLAADHLAISLAVREAGYEVEGIWMGGDEAYVLASGQELLLIELHLVRTAGGWQVQ